MERSRQVRRRWLSSFVFRFSATPCRSSLGRSSIGIAWRERVIETGVVKVRNGRCGTRMRTPDSFLSLLAMLEYIVPRGRILTQH